jgi:dihydrolipoamide dehydrogenase
MPDIESRYKLVVIGAGPGGYVAAIRAAQLGIKTLIVEREFIGGTCLNVGCIPSKDLLTATELYESLRHAGDFGITVGDFSMDLKKLQGRKSRNVKALTTGVEYLLKQSKVDIFKGEATFLDKSTIQLSSASETHKVTAENVIIATGTVPIELPGLPFSDPDILDSTKALALDVVPKDMVVIGGGAIGLEMATVWMRLGTKITIVEMLETILPGMDVDLTSQAETIFGKQGMKIMTSTMVSGANKIDGGFELSLVDAKKKKDEGKITCEKVLVSVGRKVDTSSLGLDKTGVKTDRRGFIQVDDQMKTNIPGIYAIGDIVGGKLLAHKASKEGEVAAEVIAGKDLHMDYRAVPGAVYTEPEIASVGLTEQEAKEQKINLKIGRFPFRACGRARTMGMMDGSAKVMGERSTGKVVGVHIIGPKASDLIAEATLAINLGAKVEDIAESIHSHPTLSEAVMEAALNADSRAIHILNK